MENRIIIIFSMMCIFYTKLSIFFKTKRFASPWEVGGENDARNGTEVDEVI